MVKFNKNSIMTYFVLFLALVLSTSFVFALQEDFTLFSQSNDLNVCSHDSSTNSITVKNTGDIESTYSISKTGSASGFSVYTESYFSLKPGESKTVYIYISPGSLRGNYNLKTTVQTNFGLTKSIEQNIKIDNCANINLVAKNSFVKTNPCTPAQFNVVIKNTGNFIETYQFSLDKFAKYAAISESYVALNPGESKEIILFVNPACEIYGKHDIKLQAFAQTTKFLAEIPLTLEIARAYDYDVKIADNMRFCRYENVAFEVYVENLADIYNIYDLNVKGPGWVKIEHKNLFLAPKTNTKTYLNITATEAGNFTIRVDVSSRRGDLIKSGERKIIVDNCYVVKTDIDKRKDLVVEGESKSYNVNIKNTGIRDDVYSVELTAPAWARLVPEDFSIKSGKSKSTYLEIKPNATGLYVLSVTAKSKYAQDTDDVVVEVVSKKDAYMVSMVPKNTRVMLGKDSFVVEIKNKGIRQATYELSLESDLDVELKTEKVTLNPGEKKTIVIETNSKKEGSYSAQLIAKLAGENIGYVSKFKISTGASIYEKIWNFLWLYKLYVGIGLAVLILIIPLLIFLPKAIQKAAERRKVQEELKKLREIEEAAKIEKKPSVASIILIIIGFLALLGVIVTSLFLIPGMPSIFSFKQNVTEPIIKIDASGLKVVGNNIIVNSLQEFNVPLIIQNNYNETLLFGIEEDISWLTASADEVEIEAGKAKKVNLNIKPTKDLEGKDYKLSVSVELKREDKILREAINLKVVKTTIWQEIVKYLKAYSLYFLIGFGILFILIIIKLTFVKKAEIKSATVVDKKIKPNIKLGKK